MPRSHHNERPIRSSHRQAASRRKPRNRRLGRRRRATPWILGILAVGFLGAVTYGAYTYFHVAGQIAPPDDDSAAIEQALDPVSDAATGTVEYVLLLGNDRRSTTRWTRSDTIIVARLDSATKQISLLSLPRDSRVAVTGHGMTKLGHACAYGGPALTIETVKALTGLPINHYVQVDFTGFTSIVDAVGGVTLEVDHPIKSGDTVLVPSGLHTLNGEEALIFVRDRKSYAEGDFARMRNQQTFLVALAKRMVRSENYARLPGILDTVSKNVQTDMTILRIVGYARTYKGIDPGAMQTASAPGYTQTIDGVSYVILKDAELQALVADLADGGFEGDE